MDDIKEMVGEFHGNIQYRRKGKVQALHKLSLTGTQATAKLQESKRCIWSYTNETPAVLAYVEAEMQAGANAAQKKLIEKKKVHV